MYFPGMCADLPQSFVANLLKYRVTIVSPGPEKNLPGSIDKQSRILEDTYQLIGRPQLTGQPPPILLWWLFKRDFSSRAFFCLLIRLESSGGFLYYSRSFVAGPNFRSVFNEDLQCQSA